MTKGVFHAYPLLIYTKHSKNNLNNSQKLAKSLDKQSQEYPMKMSLKFLKKCFLALTVSLLPSFSLFGGLPDPYASIQLLPHTAYFVLDSYVYYNLISSRAATIIVDVDSQDGGVSRYIADNINSLPSVKQIYSISMWQTCDPAYKHLFQRFLSNVRQENNTEWITPLRMSSLEAANSLTLSADFVSLVGAHDQHCIYQEILAWYPHLSNNGVVCGNNWYEKSIQLGATRASAVLGVPLNINGNVWYLEKTGE